MKDLIILEGFTKDELFQHIENVIDAKLKQFIKEIPEQKAVTYLTRKEAASLLRISLPTLHNLTKDGVLQYKRIGTRVLYRSDLLESSSHSYKKGFRR